MYNFHNFVNYLNIILLNKEVLNTSNLKTEKEKESINEPINEINKPINTSLVEDILKAYPEKFKNILDNADKYDVQILKQEKNM